MKTIFVNGIGVITDFGKGVEGFWNALCKPLLGIHEEVIDLNAIKNSKTRRMDRISTLAVYSAVNALEDSKLQVTDPYEVGTVFNSDYCHSNSNLKFGQFIVDETPGLASPATFINTVNNACVGYVCINLGIKGYSTMLISSNYIGYAMQLIEKDRVKSVIAGGVEEYCKNTFDAIRKMNYHACECGVTMVLSSDRGKDSYCEIISYHESNLGGHPFFTDGFTVDTKRMRKVMERAMEKAGIHQEDISLVVTAGSDNAVGNGELMELKEMFTKDIMLLRPKEILGDTLGASLGLNISLGALILKHQKIPDCLLPKNNYMEQEGSYHTILVNNYTMSGGFISYIIKR